MSAAAILLLLPAVLLLAWGAAIVRGALARRGRGTAPLVLRLVAGTGTIGWAVVAASPLWSDRQYGVVVLPVLALLGAAVWNAVLLGVAALVDRSAGPG